MLYLTLIVFIGVFVLQFPKELLKLAGIIWDKDLYRNSFFLTCLTLLVFKHKGLIGFVLYSYTQGLAYFLLKVFGASLLSSKWVFLVYGITLVVLPLMLAATISLIIFLSNKKIKFWGYQLFWIFWYINTATIIYFL